ncbi:DinB family protein [Streptomyces sp. NPDC057307]|uniref:DinB family protein n=1 Tax=Streptomyces sp. NPDC057307 TaxID=3346096 RepID=UPI003624E361
MNADELDWNRTLREQWEFHWNHQLRARLDGLTDDEYFWSPVPGAWSRHGFPGPGPADFTTIAWRLDHVIVDVLAARNAVHFGAAVGSRETWVYADGAATALDQLRTQLDNWLAGVSGLDDAALRVPVGAKEPYPDAPMADLVLHIHRELIHHLSEVCLLRDLYAHTNPAMNANPATNGATR